MVGNQSFHPFPVTFWPLEGQNWANVAQKWIISEHSRQNEYTKFEINWVITFPDYGRKPSMDGCTDARRGQLNNSTFSFDNR